MRRLGHRHTTEEGQCKDTREDDDLQAEERGFRRNHLWWYLDHGLQLSRIVKT